ncbi:basic proline-rich protein-like [Myiozetetes cayanensis]|uniref:basic proline-rich protein-like n=1 Tax=Myiozetetes cayanensis TaxID=478635 RepID=UPI00215DFAB4|nr:basic proline-rich protein-like [Myiozetetes cayanensis]
MGQSEGTQAPSSPLARLPLQRPIGAPNGNNNCRKRPQPRTPGGRAGSAARAGPCGHGRNKEPPARPCRRAGTGAAPGAARPLRGSPRAAPRRSLPARRWESSGTAALPAGRRSPGRAIPRTAAPHPRHPPRPGRSPPAASGERAGSAAGTARAVPPAGHGRAPLRTMPAAPSAPRYLRRGGRARPGGSGRCAPAVGPPPSVLSLQARQKGPAPPHGSLLSDGCRYRRGPPEPPFLKIKPTQLPEVFLIRQVF